MGGSARRKRCRWLGAIMALGTVANGVRLRRRLSGLRRLDPAPFVDAESEGDRGGDDGFVMLTSPGVVVNGAIRSAAERHARAEGLAVVDLVPENLPCDQALDLARLVIAAKYHDDALAPGRSALHALLVRRDVLARAEDAEEAGDGSDADGGVREAVLDRSTLTTLVTKLKLCAARSTDLVVVPGLAPVDADPAQRLAVLRGRLGPNWPAAIAIPAVRYGLLAVAAVLSPGWGVAALVAFCLEPYLATAGTPLRPGRAANRMFREPADHLATLWGAGPVGPNTPGGPDDDPVEWRRPEYAALLADGIDHFFEPRRDSCPLCVATTLAERLRIPDMVQFKPGEFVLDECLACGHVFQNPRLSIDGLDFYYRDFYDGLGAENTQFLFACGVGSYRGRVELARRHISPRTWLDVGAGYGHFCVTASGLLPETRFDGLDMGLSITEAERRGWINHAYRGLFPDLVDDLKGGYDVVSMHHYLEHTRDPFAELDAAHTVLATGGHLLVEVPDPESRFARLMNRSWVPWLQPQHQHLVSVVNLCAALEARGFSVVEVERGPAHQPIDLGGGLWLWANARAGPGRVPWLDPPTALDKAKRAVVLIAMAPLALGAMITDRVLQPVISTRCQAWSNTYRLLARRD